MAYVQADRVQETTTTIGTGAVTLAGAVTGYRTFGSQMANGDTCFYLIVDPATGAWETGVGTWSTGGSLARTTVLDNSAGTAPSAVSFAAGTKNVMMTQPAKGFGAFYGALTIEDNPTTNHRAVLSSDDLAMWIADATAAVAGGVSSYRSRGTLLVPTAVVNGDALAYGVYAMAHDGASYIPVGQILFHADGTVSTGKIPTGLTISAQDSTGTIWDVLDVLSTQDVLPGGLWKNMDLDGPFITGAWNAFGGSMNYPTIAALREQLTVSGTGATGTIHLEALDRTRKILTANGTANFTINLRGNGSFTLDQAMSVGDAIWFQLLAPMGTTAYYASSITLDGSAASVKWAGGNAPAAGVPSALNIYDFEVMKTAAGTFTVIGQMGAMS